MTQFIKNQIHIHIFVREKAKIIKYVRLIDLAKKKKDTQAVSTNKYVENHF